MESNVPDWIVAISVVVGTFVAVLTYLHLRKESRTSHPNRLGELFDSMKVPIWVLWTFAIIIIVIGGRTIFANSYSSYSLRHQKLQKNVTKLNIKVEENEKKIQDNAGKITEVIRVLRSLGADKEKLRSAMEAARENGYLCFFEIDNYAMSNYCIAPAWMKEGKPLLLTDDEIYIIKTRIEKNFQQDLMILISSNLREILVSGKLEYQFPIQAIKLTDREKRAIIAAYTNMVKIRHEEMALDSP